MKNIFLILSVLLISVLSVAKELQQFTIPAPPMSSLLGSFSNGKAPTMKALDGYWVQTMNRFNEDGLDAETIENFMYKKDKFINSENRGGLSRLYPTASYFLFSNLGSDYDNKGSESVAPFYSEGISELTVERQSDWETISTGAKSTSFSFCRGKVNTDSECSKLVSYNCVLTKGSKDKMICKVFLSGLDFVFSYDYHGDLSVDEFVKMASVERPFAIIGYSKMSTDFGE